MYDVLWLLDKRISGWCDLYIVSLMFCHFFPIYGNCEDKEGRFEN